ncbi:DNA polymerase III subunit gamma/tau [Pseudidiomarina homiensis]|uniref:DNA polymerase III subunit gamma/tau n=1 Tax=Pseudidiomarina homiensis TaxID=364198 RepID=UPI00215ABF38|nr:DNA polymerase III subunit gamma/tau [Pseudidiomarina homiensis]
MSYQVLARKWRPHTFKEVVGQQHVLKPVMNALASGRLHHAWLLTGTRGVGKTTIARILAKSLNCEQGITAEPCGQCGACTAIDEGRFVDLLEIDAASRTKVEDTRELLDNVQYKPTQGRYKVYLIDEVHMLSRHSFNALLKTLEEPPEHVKFLLATTDPQKLPITVLSRCLQFNLKALDRQEIAGHLGYVLKQEGITYDDAALTAIARAARGSMRDALSLTDQAIAQGEQQVTMAGVQQMLGAVPSFELATLLEQVLTGQGAELLTTLARIAGQVPDLSNLLGELQNYVHQLALYQAVPEVAETLGLTVEDQHLAQQLPAELLQVYYDILIQGRRDLNFAADVRSGVEMTLLRMLAFRPERVELIERTPADSTEVTMRSAPAAVSKPVAQSEQQPEAPPELEPETKPEPEPEPQLERASQPERQEAPQHSTASSQDSLASLLETRAMLQQKKNSEKLAQSEPAPKPEPQPEPSSSTSNSSVSNVSNSEVTQATVPPQAHETLEIPDDTHSAAEIDRWSALIDNLDLNGLARQLARNSVLEKQNSGYILWVREAWQHLLNESVAQTITQALRDSLDLQLTEVALKNTAQPTPFEIQQAIDAKRLATAKQILAEDPLAQALQRHFGAELIDDSVQPL